MKEVKEEEAEAMEEAEEAVKEDYLAKESQTMIKLKVKKVAKSVILVWIAQIRWMEHAQTFT